MIREDRDVAVSAILNTIGNNPPTLERYTDDSQSAPEQRCCNVSNLSFGYSLSSIILYV